MMKNLFVCIQLLLLSLFLVGCDRQEEKEELTEQTISPNIEHSIVQIETNYGPILVELFDDITPETVDNFIQYVEEDFYNNTLVHQVLPGFIIQAGLFDTDFQQKATHKPIGNESQPIYKHKRGTVAMMRSNHPDTATAEFFINLKDNELFDIPNGYAVFGQVIQGLEVLDEISSLSTCSRGPFFDDAPCQPVVINKVVEMS